MGFVNLLKFIGQFLLLILTFLGKNMTRIYLWMYFIYGFYLMYDKKINHLTGKGIDIDYVFIGLWFISMCLYDYIDEKKKINP